MVQSGSKSNWYRFEKGTFMELLDALRFARHIACTLQEAKQNWFSVTPATEVHVIHLTFGTNADTLWP